jgi:hypothetical protein
MPAELNLDLTDGSGMPPSGFYGIHLRMPTGNEEESFVSVVIGVLNARPLHGYCPVALRVIQQDPYEADISLTACDLADPPRRFDPVRLDFASFDAKCVEP